MFSVRLQQISGILIVLLILLDVFLTVLYARMGSGLLSPRLARTVWCVFRLLARSIPRNSDRIASFCGPVILVLLVFVWIAGLTLGNALLFHPVLGSAIQSSSGKTPTDFVSALYAGGSSISIVGAGGFSPQVPRYRLIYLFNSIVGLSVTSLTLTYLMQIYSQLQQRNTFTLKVYLATRQTGDAAMLVSGLAPDGEWSHGTSMLWELAAEMAATKEAHHFYPVLFYMRFAEYYYSMSFAALVLLDTVTIIRSALSDDYDSVKKLRALDQIWDGSLLLLTSLEDTFLPQGQPPSQQPGSAQVTLWAQRLDRAIAQLQSAGLRTSERPDANGKYLELRSRWDAHIQRLAPSMLYSIKQIDAATCGTTR
ncbi:two pore domain potassium channel family protein [Acidobacteria bacterium AB60]|nr:two pore domain potassium channel family protein [Acidobacteria bacterium AB60]